MTRDLLSSLWLQTASPQLALTDWERLLSQARRARLLGRVARMFADQAWLAGVPPAPRAHLESALRRVQRQREEARWEADCIQRALGHLPTPIILLKGAAYVVADLTPARGRLFTDIDILVAKDQLRAVELALFEAGWFARSLDPYDERYYRDWMHELPPLQHVERGTALDVHHTITPPTSRFAVDARLLLADARPIAASTAGQTRLAVLAPADMVLHATVHLMQDGDFSGGLRDLLDLADLLRAFGTDPAFWPTLAARAGALGLGVPLFDVLTQLHRLLGLTPPPETAAALAALAPGRLRNRMMATLLERALRPDHPDCDGPGTGLARWLLYVRSHWLRMPWYQVGPHLLRKSWMRLSDRAGRKAPPGAEAAPGV
jgi:hypothetical protein